jgi:hypothetical protein
MCGFPKVALWLFGRLVGFKTANQQNTLEDQYAESRHLLSQYLVVCVLYYDSGTPEKKSLESSVIQLLKVPWISYKGPSHHMLYIATLILITTN